MMNRLVSVACVLLLGGLLAGCGADEFSGSAASDGAAGATAPNVSEGGDSGGSGDAPAAAPGVSEADRSGKPANGTAVKPADVAKAAASGPATRLVRTAEITVEVKDVNVAARAIRTAAVILGGLVSNEATSLPNPDEEPAGRPRGQRSEITMRVPEPKMDDALTKVAATGREVGRTTTSDDVTAAVV